LCPKRVPKTGQKVASKNPKPKGKLLDFDYMFSLCMMSTSFESFLLPCPVSRYRDALNSSQKPVCTSAVALENYAAFL
jgi:hypothetical protein